MTPIASVIVGKYTDRTRDVRRVVLLLSFFNIAGNLFYVFPFYQWFPIFGRMLCGVPDGVKSAFVGECFYYLYECIYFFVYLFIHSFIFFLNRLLSMCYLEWNCTSIRFRSKFWVFPGFIKKVKACTFSNEVNNSVNSFKYILF